MKIATWNVNSLKVRLPQVLSLMQEERLDVLALQELKLTEEAFPYEEFSKLGYTTIVNGQKTYNGVAIVSKEKGKAEEKDNPFYKDIQKRIVRATVQGVRFICVYCVNGESVDSPKFDYKKEWFTGLKQLIEEELIHYPRLMVLGDFNVAPGSLDVYDPERWQGKVLFTEEERKWFESLLDAGLEDTFRVMYPEKIIYTWWDYRRNRFPHDHGLRIDHILSSKSLVHEVKKVEVIKKWRACERPSDHAPMLLHLHE